MTSRLQGTLSVFKRVNVPFVLIFSVFTLILLGLVVLASAGQSIGSEPFDLIKKQVSKLVFAIVCGFVAGFVDLDRIRKYSWVIGGISLLLLILVLLPGIGVTVNGARRWFDLGVMRLQASDIGKLGLIFTLAHYISINQRDMESFFKGFLIPSAIVGVTCFFILLEPDFGTAALCAGVGFSMLFLAGVRLVYLVPSLMMGIGAFFTAVFFDPVRLKRLTSFMDLEANKLDGAYQLWQGILGFASGGISGVGLGHGRQQKSFLPEAHTDFIFPVIGEELGLICTLLVVGLFVVIFLVGSYIAKKSSDIYYFSLSVGLTLCIVLQAAINIGVVTGLLPTKGMSLPFISYGGSNLVLMVVLVGLMLNCYGLKGKKPIIKAREF